MFVPLLAVSPNGPGSGKESTFSIDQSTADFRWGVDPNRGGIAPGVWSAREEDNADLRDHMVTWSITRNLGHPGNILGAVGIGFEDLPQLGDADYNDLVALVWGVTDAPVPSPAPANIVRLVAAAVGIGSWRRLRRTS